MFSSISCLVSSILLLALASSELGLAQEVCHWECEVIDCDYYADYCDYDCYEVCYPWLNRYNQAGSGSVAAQRKVSPDLARPSVATKGAPLKSKARGTYPGKVVRMKLANPSFQTMKDGQIVSTRGSPPRGFALFSDCLTSRVESTNQQINSRTSNW